MRFSLRKSTLILLALGLFGWCAATPFFGRAILEARENTYHSPSIENYPSADAIAVLTGDGPPRLRPLRDGETPSRSEAGLALNRAGHGQYLVFTSGGAEGEKNRLAAISEGVRPDDIIVVRPATDTADEARLIALTAKQYGWHRLILVTCGHHMGRARLLVESAAARVGIQLAVFAYPADSGKFFLKRSGLRNYLPSADGAERSARAVREAIGEWACQAGVCG